MTGISCIEINPSSPAIASVIWLHGLGADGNDFVPIIPELNLDNNFPIRFVFPNAPSMPVTVNNGYVMPAWYDIYSMSIDQRIDWEGIQRSVKLVDNLIEKEIKSGIPSEKIILAGFSQGAVIALTTGLRHTKKLAGILALSGYLPFAEKIISAEQSKTNQSTPIFLGHGTEDAIVPVILGEAICSFLKKHHYPVSWHSYAMAHAVCRDEIRDIAEWLKKCF
jgi:phospholipase/carboxylesterase